MIGAEVQIETAAIRNLLANIGRVSEAAATAIKVSLEAMAADVVRNKMSGQYLGVVTGTARRSITTTAVRRDAGEVAGSFGSNFQYVRAHELGFAGTVEVSQHTRRLLVTRVNRKGERVNRSERQRLGFALQGRKTATTVRAHPRTMNLRARGFIRASLTEGTPATERRVARALELLFLRGRPPVPSELGA